MPGAFRYWSRMQQNVNDRAFWEARRTLRFLLLGVDPETNEPLTEESLTAAPEVKAALAFGIDGLRRSPWMGRWRTVNRVGSQPSWQAGSMPGAAGGLRTAKTDASRSGAGWSLQEDRQIAQEFAEGQKLTMMATNHQRSRGSVLARLAHLGLMAGRG